jgi:hypothetical protein
MSTEIQIKNPTFEEYFKALNVEAYGKELIGQYRHLWKLYCTPMKSCYCNKSCTMFEAHRFFGNKDLNIGWQTKFQCPWTKKPMRVALPFVGPKYWTPIEEVIK